MKRILITGANSYIGTSFENYIKQYFADGYCVDTVDTRDGSWTKKDFSGYDTVFHVAGIAHSDNGRITAEKAKLYRSVNTELAIAVAKKAKADGAKQFIFMSSSTVYGDSAPIGKPKMITKETVTIPTNCYGESKLLAENGILPLSDGSFKVVIIRAPMVYGKNCKGNFPTLKKIAMKLLVFPYIGNKRSVLYIGNLVEYIRLMLENEEAGIFWPQNAEYCNTSELVKMISQINGKKIYLIKGSGLVLKILSPITGAVNKAFGNFCYDLQISEYKMPYQRFSLAESIKDIEHGS